MKPVALRFLGTLLGVVVGLSASAQTIWVEAERPVRSTLTRHSTWYDLVLRDQLSGGDWISNWSDTQPGTADYVVDVAKAGRYTFWVRANPVGTRLDYALDKAGWSPIKLDDGVIDSVNMAADGKLDIRFLGWKKVGEVELTQGRHALRFRMTSPNHNHGALDVFVFTTEPFLPSGKNRPGQGGPLTSKGTWPFLSERDSFDPKALLDLRGLNEPVAGQNGFVRLADDSDSFVLGDGRPVRFWALTTIVQRERSTEDLAHHARFLAKRGVNMVRFHGALNPKDKNARITDVDLKALDQAWKLVAAMKKEGIYTTISPYWAGSVSHVPASWGIEGWPENVSPQGLLFFNERLQQGYKAWWKELLTRPNPYTGIPLAQDPSVAILQLQNEDSLLFWTEQAIKGKQLELLGQKFGTWLTRKYGSLDAARKAWRGDSMAEDKLAQGIVGIPIVWELTQPRTGGRKARLDDLTQFFAETMYDFNRAMASYLRDELGCRQLINAGNWRTVDAIKLDEVERWSYTANDVLATNRYYSPVHQGTDAGWRINPGDRFEDPSALRNPRALPVNLKQVIGHPMMITESHWVPPLSYQSEAPFLVSAYQSLSGVDTFYWYCATETEWSDQDRAPWDSASRAKWNIATPMILGQFPAAALMFRQGYLRQGEPAVVEHRSLDQLWQRVPPVIAEDPGYDPNRDLGDAPKLSNLPTGVNPLAFLVGPVRVAYDGKKQAKVADLSPFLDTKSQVVSSNTGEIRLDYGRGLCGVNAPRAQGASGFLSKAETIKLNDVTIRSTNDYATVLVVSLDGLPLAESAKVLVQVGTRARPAGWVEKDTTFTDADGKTTRQGKQVDDTGKMPWAIADSRITLGVRNGRLKTATQLDANGNAQGTVAAQSQEGTLTLTLPRNALYVVLQAE